MRRTKIRTNNGATLALVIAGAFLIVLCIVAAFKLSVYLGGSQEMKNSVDAGALNVGKRVVEIKVPSQDAQGVSYGFDDVADSTHMFSLCNINRVWGKAYLVNANAQIMQQQGYGPAGLSPLQAYQNAAKINSRLYSLLTDRASTYVYFSQFVAGKPAKLLGQQGAVTAQETSDWATACVYRGEESNLQLASPLTMPAPSITANTISRLNQVYLQGYNPMTADNRQFCFTTFHAGEAPHLIANSTFEQWRKATVSGTTVDPIPNAFRESGQTDGQVSLTATASAVANPMLPFVLAIPHSYVEITLKSIVTAELNDSHGHSQSYPPTPYYSDTGTLQLFRNVNLETQKYSFPSGNKWLQETGLFNGYVSLGNELKPATLWQAINALPGDHSGTINALLQRVNEFKPGCTTAQLQALLKGQSVAPTAGGGTEPQTFYIYPTYTTPDLSDPQVRVSTNMPSWITSQSAEGTTKPILVETTTEDKPNYCWSNIIDGKYEVPNKPKPQWPSHPSDIHSTTVSGTLSWQPGTGFQQCLGILSISRVTNVKFTSWPQVN